MSKNRARTISDYERITELKQDDLLLIYSNDERKTKSVDVHTLQNHREDNIYIPDGNSISTDGLVVRHKEIPLSSTMEAEKGLIFYDDHYLYIAVDENLLKRVKLEDF